MARWSKPRPYNSGEFIELRDALSSKPLGRVFKINAPTWSFPDRFTYFVYTGEFKLAASGLCGSFEDGIAKCAEWERSKQIGETLKRPN